MSLGLVTIRMEVNTHGALEDGRINILKRTLAVWAIAFAQWLLKSRVECSFCQEHR